MIKALSNQKSYDLFYSNDSAITPLPDAPTDDQRKDHARRLEVALETGRWDDITSPGETITRFRFRQLSADEYGELAGMIANKERPFDVALRAFRLCLQEAFPMPDGAKVHHVSAGGKRLATTEFLDIAGCGGELGADIIFELGVKIYERAQGASPKP